MGRSLVMSLALIAGLFVAACGNTASSLTGTTWYLSAGTEVAPAWQWVVPPPSQGSYTILFNTGDTFSAKADCNEVAGTYTTTSPDGIAITPGPTTMAFCGEDSKDVLYASLLGQAATYAITGTDLTLTLADGGTLQYTSVAPTATPTPVVAPTEAPTTAPTPAPTATPTPTPTPTPTAAPTATATAGASVQPTSMPTAAPTPKPTAAPTPTPGQGLTGKAWQLTGITLTDPPFQGSVPAADQASYTVTFTPDLKFTAKADCNTVSGTYSTPNPGASSGILTITPGAGSIAYCGEGSLSDLYILGLGSAASYQVAAGKLVITTTDGGTLQYQ